MTFQTAVLTVNIVIAGISATTSAIAQRAAKRLDANSMPMKQISATDRVVQTIQENAAQAVTSIEATPFVGGNRLVGVPLLAGQDNLVAHKLGRQLQNWTLTNQDTNTAVWSPDSASLGNSNASAQFLNLWCGADCSVSVWVS